MQNGEEDEHGHSHFMSHLKMEANLRCLHQIRMHKRMYYAIRRDSIAKKSLIISFIFGSVFLSLLTTVNPVKKAFSSAWLRKRG